MLVLHRAIVPTVVILAALCAPGALAAPDPLLGEGFTASFGTFGLSSKTVVRVDGTTGNGDEVNVEEDLGLADQSRFRVDMTWRFAEKHKLRLMWFNNDRMAQQVLAQSITVGDDVYPMGSTVVTTLNADILELAYEYAFWRRDDWEITGSAGVHTIDFQYDIDGASDTPREADETGPLPVFGARGMWRLGSAWYLEAQAQFFGLESGGIKGRLDDYKVGATYMFGAHLGLGAGYNQFTMRITANDPAFDGAFQWRYGGPMLFLTGAF